MRPKNQYRMHCWIDSGLMSLMLFMALTGGGNKSNWTPFVMVVILTIGHSFYMAPLEVRIKRVQDYLKRRKLRF
jgi:hypothetical protein